MHLYDMYVYIYIYITQDSQCFCLSIGGGYQSDTPTKSNSKSTFQKGPFHLESNLSSMIFQGASCEISRVQFGSKLRHLKILWVPRV